MGLFSRFGHQKNGAQQVVLVLGATGKIGNATVNELSKRNPKIEILASGRDINSEKLKTLSKLENVRSVQVDVNDETSIKRTLKENNVTRVYLVTPPSQERAAVAKNLAYAVKGTKVKFLLVLSVTSAEVKDTVFGKQFSEVEAVTRKSGVSYAFVRLPLFTDNVFLSKQSIQEQGKMYGPAGGSAKFGTVAVGDVAKASATILNDPAKHHGKTYDLISDHFTYEEMAKTFSKALGKEVTYVEISYEAAKKAYMEFGFPEWQTDGVLELYKLIDAKYEGYLQDGDLESIMEDKPTRTETYIQNVAPMFQ